MVVLKLPLKEQGNDEMQSGGQGMLGKDVSFRVSDDDLQLTAVFFQMLNNCFKRRETEVGPIWC